MFENNTDKKKYDVLGVSHSHFIHTMMYCTFRRMALFDIDHIIT